MRRQKPRRRPYKHCNHFDPPTKLHAHARAFITPPPRASKGMLARAGSSVRRLFWRDGADSGNNQAESKNNNSTISTSEATSPAVLKTPVSSPVRGTAEAATSRNAGATAPSPHTPSEILPDRAPPVAASANMSADKEPVQSVETHAMASPDGSGVSKSGGGDGRAGMETGSVGPGSGGGVKEGSPRVKKSGFWCCSCIQVTVRALTSPLLLTVELGLARISRVDC